MTYAYAEQLIVDAHQVVLDAINNGANTPYLEVHSGDRPASPEAASDGTVLAVIPLTDDPAATMDSETGQITIGAADPETDATEGEAGFVRLYGANGEAIVDMEARAGLEATSGYATLNTLVIAEGSEVKLVEMVIG